MINYTLNAKGQAIVIKFVREYATDEAKPDAWFDDAELAANDAFYRGLSAVIEISQFLSKDKRPHDLKLEESWFDAAEIDAE